MKLHTTSVLAGLLLASTSLSLPLAAQREAAEAPARQELDTASLARLAKVKLGKAILIALKARPGIATGAELEAAKDGDDTVPCFEVMLLGADKSVYEVRVHAGTGKVLANEICTDAEDAGEVQAAAALEHAVSLASVAAEAEGLLRGTCLVAELVAKSQRAEVTLWNHGRKVHAGFGIADARLLDVKCTPTPAKAQSGRAEEEGEDGEETGEQDEHHERAGKQPAKGKQAKDDDDEDEDEDEAHEGAEHHDGNEPKGTGNRG